MVRGVEQKSPRHTAKKRAPAKVAAVDQSNTLNLSGKEAVVEIEGHMLKLTNLDKVYFPKDGYTKRDLLRFYDEVSPWLLPHLKDRPLSLKRYPNGIDDKFFFQKNASEHFVDWLRTEPVREGHPPKTNNYAVADNRASLIYLVNLGCIDHNPWLSRIGSLTHPDWILIDLDPFHCPFDRVVEAAQIVRGILNRVGLKGYPKTTGGDGLHVYVPLDPIYTYDQARSFAEILFHLANGEKPDFRSLLRGAWAAARKTASISIGSRSAPARQSQPPMSCARMTARRFRPHWRGARSSRDSTKGFHDQKRLSAFSQEGRSVCARAERRPAARIRPEEITVTTDAVENSACTLWHACADQSLFIVSCNRLKRSRIASLSKAIVPSTSAYRYYPQLRRASPPSRTSSARRQ